MPKGKPNPICGIAKQPMQWRPSFEHRRNPEFTPKDRIDEYPSTNYEHRKAINHFTNQKNWKAWQQSKQLPLHQISIAAPPEYKPHTETLTQTQLPIAYSTKLAAYQNRKESVVVEEREKQTEHDFAGRHGRAPKSSEREEQPRTSWGQMGFHRSPKNSIIGPAT